MANLHVIAGTQAGKVFQLHEGDNFVGRSPENDIIIKDRTVSRRHLKITRRGDKYFIADLQSRNRTFFDGNYLRPGVEAEITEGIPIAIGMSVICIGEKYKDSTVPLSDLTQPPITRGISEPKGYDGGDRRQRNNEKELAVFYKISDVLMAHLPVKETLQEILDCILELLRRIERAKFILLDPKGTGIGDIISRSRRASDDSDRTLFQNVLNRVMEEKRPLVVSDVQSVEGDEFAQTLEISKIQSMMCFPLIKEAQIIGAVYVDSRETPHAFRKEDYSLFTDLCERISKAIDYSWLTSQFDTLRLAQKEC